MVGLNDIMPKIVWMRFYLDNQGVKVAELAEFLDKHILMWLKRNDKA